MTKRQLVWGTIVAVVSLGAGLLMGRGIRGDTSREGFMSTRIESLEADHDALSRRLATALQDVARWKGLAEDVQRTPVPPTGDVVESSGNPGAARSDPARDAAAIRTHIADALAEQDGKRLLSLLADLASLGEDQYPEVTAQWIRLASMDVGALDRLGLSRIDLASALAGEEAVIRFALLDPDLDPAFRVFAAETLGQASAAVRNAILRTLDFSTERDSQVLNPLVKAAGRDRDSIYVDRFLHLVQRTDLYNDNRWSIAFMIAEIEGEESDRALDALRASGYSRIIPVLENIHSPPATGLLVTNGLSPAGDRIGHNDIILEYNGRPIRNSADITIADARTKPGDVVLVRVFRDGSELVLSVMVTDTAPGHLHFDGRPIVKKD